MLLGQRCGTAKQTPYIPMQARITPPPPTKPPKDYVPVAKDYEEIRQRIGKATK